jgi:hypothetical protein
LAGATLGHRHIVSAATSRPLTTRTPEELLDIIESKGREIDAAIAVLRAGLAKGD